MKPRKQKKVIKSCSPMLKHIGGRKKEMGRVIQTALPILKTSLLHRVRTSPDFALSVVR